MYFAQLMKDVAMAHRMTGCGHIICQYYSLFAMVVSAMKVLDS